MRISFLTLCCITLACFVAGCSTRSISNSGYNPYGGEYAGELDELSVLGSSDGGSITEVDIQAAVSNKADVTLARGSKIVLVQSGARFPDEAMMTQLQPLFSIVPLTGIPVGSSHRGYTPPDVTAVQQPLDKTYRLAAARAGAQTLMVYWGILESGIVDQATKTVSWVPIAGRIIPDEKQEMRIRIKAAVVDVATGKWVLVTPESFGDNRVSAHINRENADQKQVETLKQQAYGALAQELKSKFTL